MKNALIILTVALFWISITSTNALAQLSISQGCDPKNDACDKQAGLSCQPNPVQTPGVTPENYCQETTVGAIFGKIQAPDALKGLVGADQTGTKGIGKFLSNLIALIYALAAVVLIFMIVWGAFDWLTSGGDKEKIEGARRKIINAIIGIILFGIAFAVIEILGIFTGFSFFVGQRL